MGEKTVKLRFKATKFIHIQNDAYNVLRDGEVGEYPDEIGREKLKDFPDNFELVKGSREDKGDKDVKIESKTKSEVENKIDSAFDKMLDPSITKKK